MKWSYFPRVKGRAALWQLDEDDTDPVEGQSGKLYLIDYRNCKWGTHDGWVVVARNRLDKALCILPYDTPEEELKARAIMEWRLR